jgi:hypothetical protein
LETALPATPAPKRQRTDAGGDTDKQRLPPPSPAASPAAAAEVAKPSDVVEVADVPAAAGDEAPPPPFSLWDPAQQSRRQQPAIPPRQLAQRDALSSSITNAIAQLEAARSAYYRAVAFLDEKQKLLQRDNHSVDLRAEELSKREGLLGSREQRIIAQEKEQRELKASTISVRAKYEASLARIGELEARVAALEAENRRMAEEASAKAAAEGLAAARIPDGASSADSSSDSGSGSDTDDEAEPAAAIPDADI